MTLSCKSQLPFPRVVPIPFRLVLDLGADANSTSWGTSNKIFGKSVFGKREAFLKELHSRRVDAQKGKPVSCGDCNNIWNMKTRQCILVGVTSRFVIHSVVLPI